MNVSAAMTAIGEEMLVAGTARKKKSAEETFGERLARLRKARGYTQTELGELLGLSQRMMTYYEREGGRPPGKLLGRMAEVLGVSVDELLGLKPTKEKPAPRNSRLWRKLREIEKLPASDRRAVIKLVDGLLANHKLKSRGTRR
jgi:transcriptional regulator with XRE-family HTH domain